MRTAIYLLVGFTLLMTSRVLEAKDLSELRKQLRSGKEVMQLAALDEIAKSPKDNAGLAADICDLVYEGSKAVAARAVRVLGEMGDHASLPTLQSVVDSIETPSAVKDAARTSIKKLGPLTIEEKEWMTAAKRYVMISEDVIKLPPIDLQYASSSRLTMAKAREKVSTGDTSPSGRPPEHLEYAAQQYMAALHGFSVGDWGRMRFVTVNHVIGPQEAVVFWDNNRDYPLRLRGFSMEGIADGQDWYGNVPEVPGKISGGLDIVIVGVTDVNGRQLKTAIPLAIVKRGGISFEQFKKLKAEGKLATPPAP